MAPNPQKAIIHSIIWVLYVGVILFRFQNDIPVYGEYDWINILSFWGQFLPYFAFFYLNYHYLVPRFLIKKKYFLYFILIVGLSFLYLLLVMYTRNGFQMPQVLLITNDYLSLSFFWYVPFILSTALKVMDYWQESEVEKLTLMQEVKETELLYLKSQMSPHFLFNTLNNIYGLALNKAHETSIAISQLRDLMLYLEIFEKNKKISLDEEIKYLRSFIDLNKLRYTIPIHFLTEADENTCMDSITIEPMILLPFIENSFKHSDMSNDANIRILLTVDKETLRFEVSNPINEARRKDDIGGIGIKNVKRRLELLYPHHHSLNALAKHGNFVVNLSLQLT